MVGSIYQRMLLLILAAIIAADCSWASLRKFDVDLQAYVPLAMLSAALGGAAVFYARVRRDEHLSAMLFGTAFLIAFSASFSMLNYFLLTIAGPRIDLQLAHVDRMLGFNWAFVMAIAAQHPLANAILRMAYSSVLPEIALLIVWLGWSRMPDQIYKLCFAIAIGAAITVSFWTALPSFGAFSVYSLVPHVSTQLSLALDSNYAHELVLMLSNGPAQISPQQAKGLIGFPSFHAALAVLVAWYGWSTPRLRWPLVILNTVVLFSTPIQGGHHLIDVLAGIAVAAVSVAAAYWLAQRLAHANLSDSRAGPMAAVRRRFAES